MALTKNKFYSYITIALLSFVLISSTLFSIDFVSSQSSGTEVSGIITADTTWTETNSPYTLTGSIGVAEGVTLTVEPGVTVNLGSYYLQVNGTLVAQGMPNNLIQINGEAYYSEKIFFTSSARSWDEQTKTGCIIENANINSIRIAINDCSLKLNNNTFRDSNLFINGGEQLISNNSFPISVLPPSGTIILSDSNATISQNIITDSGIAIAIRSSGSGKSYPLIENNLFIDNQDGISLEFWGSGFLGSGIVAPVIRNNTIAENLRGISYNIILGPPSFSPTIVNNNIFNNDYNIHLLPGIQAYSGNVNATYNYWGSTDIQTITQTFYDYTKDFTLGVVFFEPFLTSPNTAAPTYTNSSANAGGLISPNGITKLNYGDSITFTITPDSGYSVADVLVNGTSIGAMGSYSLENISGATEIIANFIVTPTPTPTPTVTPTQTPIPTSTVTPTPTPTPTPSPTPDPTPSLTPTPTDNQEDSSNFFSSTTFLIVIGVVIGVSVVVAGVLIWKKW